MNFSRFQQAYEAFHALLPELLAQGHRGSWVLFHGANRIRISANRDDLYRLVREGDYPEDEILIDLIAPELEEVDTESVRFR